MRKYTGWLGDLITRAEHAQETLSNDARALKARAYTRFDEADWRSSRLHMIAEDDVATEERWIEILNQEGSALWNCGDDCRRRAVSIAQALWALTGSKSTRRDYLRVVGGFHAAVRLLERES